MDFPNIKFTTRFSNLRSSSVFFYPSSISCLFSIIIFTYQETQAWVRKKTTGRLTVIRQPDYIYISLIYYAYSESV